MRMMMGALLCLFLLVGHADAEFPTKTIGNGGWFALSEGAGYSELAATYCGGAPCTDRLFASHFGPQLTFTFSTQPVDPVLFPTRGAAVQALKNGEFALTGSMCQPGIDSGKTITIVSGHVQLYSFSHFSGAKLADAVGSPNVESWLQHYLAGIASELNDQGLGGLVAANALINPHTGQVSDQLNTPTAMGHLSVVIYDAVKRWAGQQGLVVQAHKVKDLSTVDAICP